MNADEQLSQLTERLRPARIDVIGVVEAALPDRATAVARWFALATTKPDEGVRHIGQPDGAVVERVLLPLETGERDFRFFVAPVGGGHIVDLVP